MSKRKKTAKTKADKPPIYTTSTADVRQKPPARFETYTTSTADVKPKPESGPTSTTSTE